MCHHIVRRASNVFDSPPLQAWNRLVSLLPSGAKTSVFALLSDKKKFLMDFFSIHLSIEKNVFITISIQNGGERAYLYNDLFKK